MFAEPPQVSVCFPGVGCSTRTRDEGKVGKEAGEGLSG